ncbi:MAG: hypothetical protein IJT05_09285 [Lachnospiraceae bacterium]|nr:hypothetical protein [Lachnospiraceae bacterium]
MKNKGKIAIGAAIAGLFVSATAAALPYIRVPFARPEKPDPTKRRIACVGDSVTFGSGVIRGREKKVWVTKLGQLLGPEFQTLNLGIGSRTLQDEGDFPYRTDPKGYYPMLEKLRPEAVLFMLGSNDTKPQNWNSARFSWELDDWIEVIKKIKTVTHIWLMIPPHAYPGRGQEVPPYDISERILTEEVAPIIRKAARQARVGLINLQELTEDHPEWYSDGVHPNDYGNTRIAEFIYEKIRDVLK